MLAALSHVDGAVGPAQAYGAEAHLAVHDPDHAASAVRRALAAAGAGPTAAVWPVAPSLEDVFIARAPARPVSSLADRPEEMARSSAPKPTAPHHTVVRGQS